MLATLALAGVLLTLWSGPADAATTFTVNSTSDAGDRRINGVCDSSRDKGRQCTLRAAIEEANNTSRANTIDFAIGGKAKVKTINVGSTGNGPLPIIIDTVTINGYTQRGAKQNTLAEGNDAVLKVQLNGAEAGEDADGLTIETSGSAIRGLVINRFDGDGIEIKGSEATGNRVEGNFIGTNAAGTRDLGNGVSGVALSGADNTTIGGTASAARNVISGNNFRGLLISGSVETGNKVLGNYIGTDKHGSGDLGNTFDGVLMQAAANTTIGGTASGAGNVVSGNGSSGVHISGATSTANKVEGNLIGTEVGGTTDLSNGLDGVSIIGAPNNTIGGTASGAGNVISRNDSDGVEIRGSGATGNEVLGNFVGTTADGNGALGNNSNGVVIDDAPTNTVGGTESGARNVISGNGFTGILIRGSGATGNKVEGNFVGTNASGTQDLGNRNGVVIDDSSTNTIGGKASGTRNVISGNGGFASDTGVLIGGSAATGNKVEGNFIGTNAAGTAALDNNNGVTITSGAEDNTVGGTDSEARNIISGNRFEGVFISFGSKTNKVEGNFIGTAADGSGVLGNGSDGVFIFSALNNTIGGTASGARNVIAHNNNDGVKIEDAGATGNRVLSNSIFSNTGQGIDLGQEGVTANDDDDTDAGANNLQNFPVITSVIQSSSFLNPTRISGTLNSTPSKEFTVQCFLADNPADPSGHGEGQGFVAEDTTVTTDANGDASFECNFLFPLSLEGKKWSATATNELTGDTSEFSEVFES